MISGKYVSYETDSNGFSGDNRYEGVGDYNVVHNHIEEIREQQ